MKTIYLEEEKLVITQLTGLVDETAIDQWDRSLQTTLQTLKPNTRFKILVNIHGFKAQNYEVHKKFRVIIPQTLARYGWYVGYLRMFPEAELTIYSTNAIYCVAAAHVHDDETKIKNYSENFSMKHEGFFTDPVEARNWINSIKVES